MCSLMQMIVTLEPEISLAGMAGMVAMAGLMAGLTGLEVTVDWVDSVSTILLYWMVGWMEVTTFCTMATTLPTPMTSATVGWTVTATSTVVPHLATSFSSSEVTRSPESITISELTDLNIRIYIPV